MSLHPQEIDLRQKHNILIEVNWRQWLNLQRRRLMLLKVHKLGGCWICILQRALQEQLHRTFYRKVLMFIILRLLHPINVKWLIRRIGLIKLLFHVDGRRMGGNWLRRRLRMKGWSSFRGKEGLLQQEVGDSKKLELKVIWVCIEKISI